MGTIPRRWRSMELLLFAIAFAAYLPGIQWGLPYATGPDRLRTWATDDISPIMALIEVYHTFNDTPVEERWLGYPLMHHFTLVASYSPYLGWLYVTGQWQSPSAYYPFGFNDPITVFQTLTVIARLVSLAMAAGIVVIAYRLGMMLWDQKTGILAALIAGIPYPMFYYAKTGNVDLPALFWSSLALLAYAALIQKGISTFRCACLGVFAGLATATKDQSAGLFLLLPLVLLPMHIRQWKAGKISWWGPPAALLLSGAAALALGSGFAFHPPAYVAHLSTMHKSNAVRDPDYVNGFLNWHPLTLGAVLELGGEVIPSLVAWFGPLLTVVGGATLVLVGIRESSKLAFALPMAGYFMTVIWPIHHYKWRYGMPIAFVFGIFAARGLAWASDRWKLPGWSQVVVAAVLLAWPAGFSADLVYQMFNDTRRAAGAWLQTQMASGARIATFGHGKALPHLRADTGILELPRGEAEAWLARERPEMVAVMPDWTSAPGMEHSGWCAVATHERLQNGLLGYRLAARFRPKFLLGVPRLDYPSVNPPIQIYLRRDVALVSQP